MVPKAAVPVKGPFLLAALLSPSVIQPGTADTSVPKGTGFDPVNSTATEQGLKPPESKGERKCYSKLDRKMRQPKGR